MYKHLLVPLDGSRFSEAAIPISIYLAKQLRSKITLIHIIEQNPPQSVHGERHLRNQDEALSYLTKMKADYYPPELDVDFHIHSGDQADVVKALAKHHQELSADLIVMTTHGWGGIKEIFFGNIAQQILNLGTMPVLFVPSDSKVQANDSWLKKILVPLDGTGEHELGLEAAISLAGACVSELILALVIPTINTLSAKQTAVGVLLPAATKEVLKLQETDAENYLKNKTVEIENLGIKVTTGIRKGDPSNGIPKFAEANNVNLIVMGTHGKVGLNAFWSGSIAAKITNKADSAILFVPILDKKA